MTDHVLHFYAVTLRHDRGLVTIHTSAPNMLKAAEKVICAEGAPPSAVQHVRQTDIMGRDLPRVEA